MRACLRSNAEPPRPARTGRTLRDVGPRDRSRGQGTGQGIPGNPRARRRRSRHPARRSACAARRERRRQVDADPSHLRRQPADRRGDFRRRAAGRVALRRNRRRTLGIAVVHQHFNLAPQLSVAENLFLSRSLPRRAGLFVNWSETRRRAEKLLARVGLNIDPWTEVSQLRPDESAMVAIAKAIGSDAKIIILDEPTSALLPAEVSILFGHMRRLAYRGPFVSLCQPPPGGSVRNRRPRHGPARRTAGRRLDARGDCRAGRSSRPSSAETSPGSKTPPPRSPLTASRSSSPTLWRAEGFGISASNCARAKSSALPACQEAAPRRPWTCCSPGRQSSVGAADSERPKPSTLRSPRDAKNAGIALVPKNRHAESLLAGRQRAREHLASQPQSFCHRSVRPVHPSRPGAG